MDIARRNPTLGAGPVGPEERRACVWSRSSWASDELRSHAPREGEYVYRAVRN